MSVIDLGVAIDGRRKSTSARRSLHHFTNTTLSTASTHRKSNPIPCCTFPTLQEVICVLVAHNVQEGEWACQVPFFPPHQTSAVSKHFEGGERDHFYTFRPQETLDSPKPIVCPAVVHSSAPLVTPAQKGSSRGIPNATTILSNDSLIYQSCSSKGGRGRRTSEFTCKC